MTRAPLDAPAFVLTRCTVRPWRAADVESMVRYANNPKVADNLRDAFPHPYTRRHAEQWLANAAALDPRLHWAIEVAGEAAGGIGIHAFEREERNTAELGYWLGEPFWGRGIVSEAVAAMTEYAFAEFDIVRLEAGVYEGNAASMRVLEKAGFVLEGRLCRRVIKNGVRRDVFIYAIVREG